MRSKNKLFKTSMIYFLMFFFIITTSLWIHELIHVHQLRDANQNIDEICLTGWKNTGNQDAVGWVKSTVDTNLDRNQLETQSIFIQVAYISVLGFFFSKLL